MSLKKKLSLAGFLAAYVLLIWLVWDKLKSLSLTCTLMALAIACLGFMHSSQEVTLPPVTEGPASGRASQCFFGLAGIGLAWLASLAGIAGHMFPMACWMLGAALAFRLTTFEALPTPKARTLTFLTLGVVALGALFRLWRAGAVPVGECGTDESLIWSGVWGYASGIRLTYDPANGLGADGIIPIYMLMAGVKVFGSSMLAWRLEGILCGIGLTALFYRLGKESLGLWVGLAAAFFWGVSVWPVTVTRAVYYISETIFLSVACLLLVTLAIRKGGAWRFAAAGLLWAFCFNAYPAARVMLALVPWLYALLWFSERSIRPSLQRSAAPLLSGFIVGIAPLALWLWLARPESTREYFVAFTAEQEGGHLLATTLWGKMNEAFAHVIDAFPGSWNLLTKGTKYSAYFPADYPMLHPWLFALAVLGACMALARFRNAFYAFILYWWFLGLLPSLAAAGSSDRRVTMALPPTLLLAGLGFETLARWGRAALGKTRTATFVLSALVLAGAGIYAWASWRDYFDRNQHDAVLLLYGRAADTQVFRDLHASAGPRTVLITTWKSQTASWYASFCDANGENELHSMLPGMNVYWYQRNPVSDMGAFNDGGFLAALRWAWNTGRPAVDQANQGQADVMILLDSFYEYLTPGLKAIGAETVAEVDDPISSMGPLAYSTMARLDNHPGFYARLMRIPNLDQAKISRYAQRAQIPFTIQELQPPRGWSRAKLRQLDSRGPDYRRLAMDYRKGRGWHSTGKPERFSTDDPWFWTTSEVLPGTLAVPYQVLLDAKIMIPEDGDYAFGASADVQTKIRIDQHTVFDRDPLDPAEQAPVDYNRPGIAITWMPEDAERRGFLGPKIHLTRGEHSLLIEQAVLSYFPNITEILRPVWQAPGQKMETLPLELLRAP